MLKTIGRLTIATNRANVGAYFYRTPYRTIFAGVVWRQFFLGRSHTPGVRAFALGPLVFGRFNLQDVGKAVQK